MYNEGYLNRYNCEFDFIPNVLTSQYIKGEIDDYVMTHPIEWRKILNKKGIKSDFGIDEIYIEKEGTDPDKAKFVFTFPKPKVTPECFYAILFIEDEDYKYFTLELDFGSLTIFKDGGGMVCGQKGHAHLNYGRRCKEDLEAFKNLVNDIIQNKPYSPKDMFNNFNLEEMAKLGINDEFFSKSGIDPKIAKEKCNIF